jgi:hypothetical protein
VPLLVQKVVMPHGMPFNLVLEGQRRVLAGREVLDKDELIPVIDRTPEPVELTPEVSDKLLLDMLAVAVNREGLSSFELSEAASRLRDRDRTLADISKAIGKSESWISKILKARQGATPKLMLQWRKGEITDEQFKDLAEVKNHTEQEEKAKGVVEARKSGDLGEARIRAKEVKETAKAEAKPKTAPAQAKPKAPPVVTGPQRDLFHKGEAKPITPPAPPKPKAPSRAILDDMLHMAEKRPPTADYVKGVMDGVRYACGLLQPDDFSKAWQQYVNRIEGKSAKPKAKKAKGVKTAKAKRPAKKKKGRR